MYDSTGCMYKASALANFFSPDILRKEKYDSTGCMYKASALANFFSPDRILNDILKLCYKFDANNSLF